MVSEALFDWVPKVRTQRPRLSGAPSRASLTHSRSTIVT
jgi:hypothetical protein